MIRNCQKCGVAYDSEGHELNDSLALCLSCNEKYRRWLTCKNCGHDLRDTHEAGGLTCIHKTGRKECGCQQPEHQGKW